MLRSSFYCAGWGSKMIILLYNILSEFLGKFMKIRDWVKSWLFPVTQLTATKSAITPFLHFNSMYNQQESSNETLCAFMKSKELFELALIEWCMSPPEVGFCCYLYYALYTAVICTVWIQTAVAVLILINKVLGSPFIFMCFLRYRKTVTCAIGMLSNLESIVEVISS